MREIAHRGYAGRHAENTVSAVREAAATADCVEVDVRRCADGLVTCHDATVDRVTDGTGRVADRSTDELADLSVLGGPGGIPRLEDVLDAVPADVGVVLELKERGIAEEALSAARASDSDLLVSAFDPATLREVRDVDPSVPRAHLTAGRPVESVRTATDLGCAAVHARADLCLRSRVVPRAHDAGLTVSAWTVSSRLMAWLLGRRGVDGLIADVPETARRWL